MNRTAGSYLALIGALTVSSATPMAHAEPNTASYELQERCGKLAAQVFAKDYHSGRFNRETGLSFDYRAHYNARLNKCFFLEMGSLRDERTYTSTYKLFDLLENRVYGSFQRDSDKGVLDCTVQGKRCRSEDVWHELAKPFLEE